MSSCDKWYRWAFWLSNLMNYKMVSCLWHPHQSYALSLLGWRYKDHAPREQVKLLVDFGMFECLSFILAECSPFHSASTDKVIIAQCESCLQTVTFCVLLSLLSVCQCFWIVNFGWDAFGVQWAFIFLLPTLYVCEPPLHWHCWI